MSSTDYPDRHNDENAETVILSRDEFADDGPHMFKEASLVDLLRQDLQEITEIKDVYIPVQGYEKTGMAVRYRLPESGKELDSIGRRVMREFKDTFSRNLYISIDTIITLCLGIYVKPPNMELEDYVELDPEEMGMPVHFDVRMASILGMDDADGTARQIVKKVFGYNDMAIVAHAEKLNRWLMNTKADLSLEMWQVGEAQE